MTKPDPFALYPFLAGADRPSIASLLESVRLSMLDKAEDVCRLREEMASEHDGDVEAAGRAIAERVMRGGKILAFGNGGSATDAEDIAADCLLGSPRIPAVALSSDSATFSALANDVGVECTFSRQVAALGSAQDVIVGISTSGESANVLAALEAGRKAGVLTVALTGYDGGSISRDDLAEYCFVARRQFVPRIQEGHATLWHGLLFTIRQHMVEATQ